MQFLLTASILAVATSQVTITPYTGSIDLGGCTNSAIHSGNAINFDGGEFYSVLI